MKHFTVLTLFPEFVRGFAETGVIGRAAEHGLVQIATINPRDFADNQRGTVDDAAYGGGPGMVMQVQPLRKAIAAARSSVTAAQTSVIYLSPQGSVFTQSMAQEFKKIDHLILLAGRYEGIDQRVIDFDIDQELSLGDFVLSGGEIAAMAVMDAVIRVIPGVLGNVGSGASDSFSNGLLQYPQYSRPESVDGQNVPSVLLGGDHLEIARWRRKMALGNTALKRPDLLDTRKLSPEDEALLAEFRRENAENDV